MTGPRTMQQVAPYPAALADLVSALSYRQHLGWKVWLEDDLQRDDPEWHGGEARGMTLVVQRHGPDSYHPEQLLTVNHYFIVPAATFDKAAWQRWLFDTLGLVDLHERMEDFVVGGVRPYAPNHGPGRDPYVVHDPAPRARLTELEAAAADPDG